MPRTTTRSLRNYVTLLLCVSVAGCAGLYHFLDKMSEPPTWPQDKIPVYPRQVLDIPRRELDKYRCVQGVLYCETPTGTDYQCECVDVQ